MSTRQSASILIVDDDTDVLLAAEIILKKEFTSVQTESDPDNLPGLLVTQNYDVILLDMNFVAGQTSGEAGLSWLCRIQETSPSTRVVLMTAYGGLDLAVEAIKQGASDFVVKPWENAKLVATISAACQHSKSVQEVSRLNNRQEMLNRFSVEGAGQIIGESDALRDVLATVSKVAATDASVLILGENGTGKELVARAIHQQSLRAGQPFVNVDIGAIAESLFESELFGYNRGAFTDAKTDRPGRFEVARGGTLFLDEIGNLNVNMQAKLLGVLQSRTISRLGSDRPVEVDVRLISATNMPLYEMVDDFRFRQDLLYRINTVEVRIPSLRERQSDIPLLCQHFARLYGRKYNKPGVSLEQTTLQKLTGYDWPGNIRELQHAVERAVIMTESQTLQPADFNLNKSSSTVSTMDQSLNLDAIEKNAIQKALVKHQGNMSKAASELGLGRSTLYRKIEKHGL